MSGDLTPCRLSDQRSVSLADAKQDQSVFGAVGIAETKIGPRSQNTIADLDHPTLQAVVDVARPGPFVMATDWLRGEGNRTGGLAQTPPQWMQHGQGAVAACRAKGIRTRYCHMSPKASGMTEAAISRVQTGS